MSSLLSRQPVLAFKLGRARVTLVLKEDPDELPTLQVVDPSPQNLILNVPKEFAHVLAQGASMPADVTEVTYFDHVGTALRSIPLKMPAERITLNFSNLGSATAAVILLLTGTPPHKIDWAKVIPEQVEGNPKDPKELEAFIAWHLHRLH